MYKLSDILSKQIVNLYSGKCEGTIKDISFDEKFKQAKWLILFDEESEEFALDINKIYMIGENAITIKNSDGLFLTSTLNKNLKNNPINLPCYTVGGNLLGKLNDIEFNKNFYVSNFYAGETIFPLNKIVNIGNSLIIINNENKKIKLSNFKPKMQTTETEITQIVSIQKKEVDSNENTIPKIEEIANVDTPTKKPFIVNKGINQQKILSNQNFLLGRKATKTIYGINNEIIIKKDNLINSKILEYAKLHNKISELAVFSKSKQ